MATKVVMEALSPTMEEGRLVEWKKNVGDPVATGDVLAEVETDKAVMELVARADGVLLQQVVPAGSTVPVADVVGWIGAAGETVPGATASDDKRQKATTSDEKRQEATEPVVSPSPVVAAAPSPVVAAAPSSGRVKASPVARKIAAEKGLDLSAITGSGPEGRVIKPLEGYGLKVMSMGFLVDEDTPVVWRGPMVVSALSQ
ncbi:MAG TPA: E3 binding domain-containing protein, partial [Gemmatimonadales bacterium]|nr:E3 binding domain-containing protein [Gemmatimonadales bacterium]